jgi:pyruvate,water dikinase
VPNDSERHAATVLWSNANVNENFPQPISPLLYSIASVGYYHYFRNLGLAFGISRRRLAAMDRPLRAIIGVHGARMYYNLTSIHAVLRMAPFGDRLTSAFNQFVGANETAARPAGATGWGDRHGRVAQVLEIFRIAAQTTWQYLFLRRRVESFERVADAFALRTHPDKIRDRSLAELLEDLHSFVDIRCHRWKNASLADAASMVCYALLQRALVGTGGSVALHNRLLRALPGMPSSIPPLRLWELSRTIRSDEVLQRLFATADAADVLDTIRRDGRFAAFLRAFDRYLEDWGFRSSAELMLTVPSLQEDPAPAIELLKRYAASDGEPPESAISRQAAERLDETSRLLRRLVRRSPIEAAAVWLLLRCTQRAVTYRERARLKQALLYARCRHLALALGERLVSLDILHEPDEVFMLTWQEIDELGSGRSMFPYRTSDLVSLRRRDHAALAAMCPADTIRLPEGRYLPLGQAPPHRRPADVDDGAGASSVFHGTGACGGLVTARAAVLDDVRDIARLQRGEVLVTRQTDPGWALVFCLISGLVIERGGMLSHGAILAREFGLPCVVGVQDATRRIAHGARVTVDGDLGTCAIGREPSAGSSLQPDADGGPS